jgi:hypothetical protein
MNVKVEIIPHEQQRYPTCGDWIFGKVLTCPSCKLETRLGGLPPSLECPVCKQSTSGAMIEEMLTIRVSKLSDWRQEMLVAIHELVEVCLCKEAGVTQEAVDAFDMNFEANRKPGDDSEPGDAPNAPYREQHRVATYIERFVAHKLNVDWKQYEEELSKLP